MNNNKLGLDLESARRRLNRVANKFRIYNGRPIKITLDDEMPQGSGFTDNYTKPYSDIRIGIQGLSERHGVPASSVNDFKFTRALVLLCHEYGHYIQAYGPNKNPDTIISATSTIGNPYYYYMHWAQFPHEISAEATGVSLAWDAMNKISPQHSDECMLEYVNWSAECRISYMLPVKPEKYGSREEVMIAFEAAMEKSLETPRILQDDVLSSNDEFARILAQGHKVMSESPNAYHIGKLTDEIPGRQTDRMIAALALYLHPDFPDSQPMLRSEGLSIESAFGMPLKANILPDENREPILRRGNCPMPDGQDQAKAERRRIFEEFKAAYNELGENEPDDASDNGHDGL